MSADSGSSDGAIASLVEALRRKAKHIDERLEDQSDRVDELEE